jgi:pimeloyl-ACP methyl ester carboxylesterase
MSTTSSVPFGLRHDVILVPGAVLPAEPAYGGLLEALGDQVVAVAKELEVYGGEEPPPNYTLDAEVEGIRHTAKAAGFECFHLVGYSAGGASCLAFAATHPERLRSLALLEAAWAGNEGLDPAEQGM